MRKKEDKFLVTFNSTTDAMALEKTFKENNVPGRIIPVPRSISESCGLCWSVPAKDEDIVREAVDKHDLSIANYYHRDLF